MEQKQKLITVCIPAYNSEPFLHYAVDSLIPFGEDIEVIIIDDGSKDGTGAIADKYQEEHPDFIKAVHQPNGGHGEGINHGIELATGIYYKVLDSDDWVDHDGFKALLDDIKANGTKPDLYLANYTYWQGRENRDKTINFAYLFKGKNKKIAKGGSWAELKDFKWTGNLTLHSSMYKTEILRQSGVHCPAHVSYEDNYFIYASLHLVKYVRYVPVSVYQYLIGRDGQSMQNATLLRKYKDFITDGKLIFDAIDVFAIEDKKTRRVVKHHFIMNMTLTVLYGKLRGDKEGKEAVKEFWQYAYAKNKRLAKYARHHYIVNYCMLPGNFFQKIAFWIGHKIVKFN